MREIRGVISVGVLLTVTVPVFIFTVPKNNSVLEVFKALGKPDRAE